MGEGKGRTGEDGSGILGGGSAWKGKRLNESLYNQKIIADDTSLIHGDGDNLLMVRFIPGDIVDQMVAERGGAAGAVYDSETTGEFIRAQLGLGYADSYSVRPLAGR